ncbi:MAG: alpha-tubulin suppressor-like RCC1 family protein [bacterium]|jgi:alpha-tubulin suppressor-like RCC1 family protein/UDP-3-O-[3-hydroxymyristoyl] glucosamine N-acyltransferase
MTYSRILLFAPLLATATVAFAADLLPVDGCEDVQFDLNGACIDDTVTTTSQTSIGIGVSVGPWVALGEAFLAKNATIEGWVAHSTQPLTIGDGAVVGRNANIDADSILGSDTSIGRDATLGARATTGVGVYIGNAAELGTDVVLDDGAVIGNQAGLGNFTHMGPLSVIGRNSTVTGAASAAERSDILGIVGPDSIIGEEVFVSNTARVRKGATLETGAQIMAGATIGKFAVVENGATVHGLVKAYGRVCAGDTVVTGQVVARNMTNQGTTTCSTPPGLVQRARPLAVGGTHACAVLPDETAVCWGWNSQGQLGDGTQINKSLPTVVPGLTDVAGFALATQSSCALKTDGTVWCWGSNSSGQLGLGISTGTFLTPQEVTGITDATAIATAYHHYCAVKSDTTVMCWGYGYAGGLGRPGLMYGGEPGVTTAGITNGDSPELVIAADGNALSGMLDIAVGAYGSCALAIDGQVFCWGHGDTLGGNGVPSNVYGNNYNTFTPLNVDGLANITEISMGQNRAFALQSDGTVMGWGSNTFGEMGNTTNGHRRTPVTAFTGAGAVAALGAYEQHSCMLLTDAAGTMVCGGDSSSGVLGAGSGPGTWPTATTPYLSPIYQPGMEPVNALAHGGAPNTTCARTTDGTVWCWGLGGNGSLGNGTTPLKASTPVQVSGLNMGPL